MVSDDWSNGNFSRDLRSCFPRERTAGEYSRNITVTNKSNSLTYTVASSFASTPPLAVTTICEGGGDVVGVVTPLVGGVAQAFHGDQVVELRVQLAVQEVEGKEEDRKGQVEVEEEKRLKEVRSWMTMEMFMTRLRS